MFSLITFSCFSASQSVYHKIYNNHYIKITYWDDLFKYDSSVQLLLIVCGYNSLIHFVR
jgi:hypothetical protein